MNQTPPITAAPTSPPPGNALGELLGEPPRRPWYLRRWLWLAVAALLLAAGGLTWWWQARAARAAPSYSTVTVGRGDITLTVTANGTVQPTRAINIGSELSGTVLKVNVDVNDPIQRGQVLVELDTARLHDQILRSQAALAAARARHQQSAATLAEASAMLARQEAVARLSGGKVPAQAELDSTRATLARAQAEHASTQAGINDALAALSTDQTNLAKAAIRAPADGVVLTRSVDPGNTVAASLQAVTLLTIAESLNRLRLWVYVDEADVGDVKIGQPATFTVSAYLGRPFPARVTRVGFGPTLTDNVVTYLTYLDVDNSDRSLRPGMTATASIVARQRKNVLQVPNAALRYTPSNAAANAQKGLAGGISFGPPKTESQRKSAADNASTAMARRVWVLPATIAGHGAAVPLAVAVLPGISDGHMTEITGGDLQAGMQVITAQKTAAAP